MNLKLSHILYGKRRSLFQTFIEYLKYERDLRGFISKSAEVEVNMGDIGYIFGYALIGAFLLGALVGFFIGEHKEK